MNPDSIDKNKGKVTLITFRVGELLCGMEIGEVDEIKRIFKVTRVHRAPEYVSGVVNIRGEIVTVIDLKIKMNIENIQPESCPAMIVVRKEHEQIGLLVDSIEDTVLVGEGTIEPPPANISASLRCFLSGIYKTGETLVTILNRTTLVERDHNEEKEYRNRLDSIHETLAPK